MSVDDLNTHLKTGATHVCHCWSVTRADGMRFGFTDHDRALTFDGIEFVPDTGMSAKALASTTGLSVNNTEALGVLSADAITNADLEAGRYDGAAVAVWLVQWDDIQARELQFAGTIGEIVRENGSYRAELRGLTEQLNQETGRAYLRTCSAVLGDARCGVDTDDVEFAAIGTVTAVTDDQYVTLTLPQAYTARWFEAGALRVIDGDAYGLLAPIKADDGAADSREITLWQPLRASLAVGDQVKLIAGCDKRAVTCREKFRNLLNFQGFPDIPGDDWLMSVPRSSAEHDGGSLTR